MDDDLPQFPWQLVEEPVLQLKVFEILPVFPGQLTDLYAHKRSCDSHMTTTTPTILLFLLLTAFPLYMLMMMSQRERGM